MRAPDPGGEARELLSRPLVKVCGLTREEDVAVAVEAGADLVGFILAPESPRRADASLDVPDTVLSVARLRRRGWATCADLVQLYARENGHSRPRRASSCATATRSRACSTCRGTSATRSTGIAPRAPTGRVMLAGGLGPENVARRRSTPSPLGRRRRSFASERPGDEGS